MGAHKKTSVRRPPRPKRKLFAASLALLLLVLQGGLEAQNAPTKNDIYEAYTIGVAIVIDATARTFLNADLFPADFGRAELVSFRVECDAVAPCGIRITIDGTTATASVGQPFEELDTINIFGFENIENFSAIRTGANSGSIQPTFHRQ